MSRAKTKTKPKRPRDTKPAAPDKPEQPDDADNANPEQPEQPEADNASPEQPEEPEADNASPEQPDADKDVGQDGTHESRPRCRYCLSSNTKVRPKNAQRVYGKRYRDPQDGIVYPDYTRRFRKCLDCNKLFPTYEGAGKPKPEDQAIA